MFKCVTKFYSTLQTTSNFDKSCMSKYIMNELWCNRSRYRLLISGERGEKAERMMGGRSDMFSEQSTA